MLRKENEYRSESILEAFQKVMPYLQYFFDDDISVALIDTEQFLDSVEEGKLKLNSRKGDPIPEGGAARIVLRSGVPTVKDVPAHVYGKPFRSYAVPLKDDYGNVVGAVMLARDIENSNRVRDLSTSAVEKADNMSEGADHLVNRMQDILKANDIIVGKAEEIREKSADTGKILETMQNVVKQSNLLAINASIEAARVGEAGKGFAVVAKRLEELSKSTGDSITMVKNIIAQNLQPVEEINAQIADSNKIFEEQAAELERMSKMISEIASEIQDMAAIMNKL